MRQRFLALMILTLGAISCESSRPMQHLLRVSGVSPRAFGPGDPLELAGEGFPEGKPARIVFRGDLLRPGRAPERDVEIVARTQSTTARSIALTVTEELSRAFCGEGDRGIHTTFRGQIMTAFSPRNPGAPPVTGVIEDVVLDVEPALPSPELQRQRDEEARQSLAFLGLSLNDGSGGDCCVVARASGRAAAAGLLAGDRIVDFDGVTVKSAGDILPSSASPQARLAFRRGESPTPILRELDVQGFRAVAPGVLAPAVTIALLAMGCLLLVVYGAFGPLRALERSLVVRLKGQSARHIAERKGLQLWKSLRAGMLEDRLPEHAFARLLTWLTFVALSALIAMLGLRVNIISSELDLPLAWFATTVAVALGALLLGVRPGRRGLLHGLAHAGRALLHQLPLLAAFVAVVSVVHGLRTDDVAHAQGALPHQWLAFHDPALLLLTLLAVAALVPQVLGPCAPGVAAESMQAELLRPKLHPALEAVGFLVGSVHLWLQAVFLVLILFGGWWVPGVAPTTQSSSLAWQVVGAAVLGLKTWSLITLIGLLRWTIGGIGLHQSSQWFLRRGLGLGVLGVVAVAFWSLGARRWALGWLESVVPAVLLALTVTTLLLAARRVSQGMKRPSLETGINPWL